MPTMKSWPVRQRAIARRLNRLRVRAGLSHAAFASQFGYAQQASIRWCSGQLTPCLEVLVEIANRYRVPLSTLTGR